MERQNGRAVELVAVGVFVISCFGGWPDARKHQLTLHQQRALHPGGLFEICGLARSPSSWSLEPPRHFIYNPNKLSMLSIRKRPKLI